MIRADWPSKLIHLYRPDFQNGISPDTVEILGLTFLNLPPPGADIHFGYFLITPTIQGVLVFDTATITRGDNQFVTGIGDSLGNLFEPLNGLPFDFPTITVICEGAVTQDFSDIDCDGILNVFDNCPSVFNPTQQEFDTLSGAGNACFMPQYLTPMTVVAREALGGIADSIGTDPQVNLRVRDPDGFAIGYDSINVFINEIGDSASYFQLNGSDSVVINNPKSGVYIIEAIAQLLPEPASGTRLQAPSYTIGIRTDGTVETVFGVFINPITSPPIPPSTSGFMIPRDIIDTLDFLTIPFLIGDANASDAVNIADITYLIARIFAGGPAPVPYAGAGDANCDKSVNISDITFLIARIFAGGAAPGCN